MEGEASRSYAGSVLFAGEAILEGEIMRSSTILVLAVVCVLALAVVASTETNKYGVADVQKITFTGPVLIRGTLLPAGEYEVRHTIQGEDHIMVFQQLHVEKPAQAQVKCTLVPM
jgi:hypothetical protein